MSASATASNAVTNNAPISGNNMRLDPWQLQPQLYTGGSGSSRARSQSHPLPRAPVPTPASQEGEDDLSPTPLSSLLQQDQSRSSPVSQHNDSVSSLSQQQLNHQQYQYQHQQNNKRPSSTTSSVPSSSPSPTTQMNSSFQNLQMQQQLQQQKKQQAPRRRKSRQQSASSQTSSTASAPAPTSSNANFSTANPTSDGSGGLPEAMNPFLLPSTMMPPSVLASVLPPSTMVSGSSSSTGGTSSSVTGAAQSSKKNRKKTAGNSKSTRVETPQDALDRLLSLQGYGKNIRIKAEQANYDTTPSPLQLASFGTELVKAIHTSDSARLSDLLSAGLSPNPCNQFRDSIVDLVCKRANATVFKCLVENGCDLRVCDGFGRTPFHHCCWANAFCRDIAELILEADWKQLLIEDKRGQTPLDYVRADHASDWIEFLEDNKDKYFPAGGKVPELTNLKTLRPDGLLPDPPNALPIQLAAAVSAGQMTPAQARNLSPEMLARFKS